MRRTVVIACSILAALAAALLLSYGPSVVVSGHTRSCDGVIVTTEANDGLPHDGGRACDQARDRWAWYAAGLGFMSLVAGLGAASSRREDEPTASLA